MDSTPSQVVKIPLQTMEIIDNIFERDPLWGAFLALDVLLPIVASVAIRWNAWLFVATLTIALVFLVAAVAWRAHRGAAGPILPSKHGKQRVFIGCRVGRYEVECGAMYRVSRRKGLNRVTLEVGALNGTEVHREFKWKHHTRTAPEDPIAMIAETIIDTAELLRDSGYKADSIGIAIPGVVDVVSNEVRDGFLSHYSVVTDLVSYIATSPRKGVIENVLGVALDQYSGDLIRKIRLDNDVRCAMRAHQYLAHQHGAPPQNAMCINIGRGLGSSFAFAGKIHYGSTCHAGEIGRIKSVAPALAMEVIPGARQSKPISHRRKGELEWEELLSCEGLALICRAVDANAFKRWLDKYITDHRDKLRYDYDGDRTAWEREFWQDCLNGLPHCIVSDSDRRVTGKVLDCYGELLANTLAALIWALDIEDIMLYGMLIETLMNQTPDFKENVEKRVIELTQRYIYLGTEVHTDWEWKGAALISADDICTSCSCQSQSTADVPFSAPSQSTSDFGRISVTGS